MSDTEGGSHYSCLSSKLRPLFDQLPGSPVDDLARYIPDCNNFSISLEAKRLMMKEYTLREPEVDVA